MFSDIGLSQIAISSKRFDDEDFRRSLWTVQAARGLLISLFLLALGVILLGVRPDQSAAVESPSSVYLHPSFPYVLMVLALLPFLGSLEPIGILDAARRMNTRMLVKLEVATQLASLVCMIAYALFVPSVWALVVGAASGAMFRLSASYALFPGFNLKLQLRREHWAEIIHFGKWITLSSVIGFVALSGDRLILGLLVSPALLGFYAIAHLLVTSLDQCLAKVISSVVFPVLSDAHRNRPERLHQIYYRMQVPISTAVWFLTWFVYAAAPLIVTVLYDSRYTQTAQILSLLSLILLAGPLSIALQLLLSMGNARWTANAAAVRVAVSLGSIWLLYPSMGMPGVALAAVLGAFSVVPVVYRALWYRGFIDWRKEILVVPAGVGGFAMGYGVAQLGPYFA